ncbi:MAG TPA: hypothetical protein VNA17_12215, partial [Pyrinomonadaceae bacterium]|nr:hypothetical protein [Pyrinomonadaceae bacterium]
FREQDVDIVEAVKETRGDEALSSKLSAGLFYFLWSKLGGFEIRGASDFKLLSRGCVDAYLQMNERNVFFRGMIAWLGFRRAQIPFHVGARKGGKSGWSLPKRVRLALDGLTGFSALPLQIVTLAGIGFLTFSLIFGIYTLLLHISGQSISGFATVILLLLIIGSVLMISLGIIGIYLEKIYEEIKNRPRYVISETAASPNYTSRDTRVIKTNQE